MKSEEIKSRIEKLEIEKKQLDKRQRNLEALMNEKKKNEDTRRKIILGSLILKELEKNKGLKNYVLGLIESLSERDKNCLNKLHRVNKLRKISNQALPRGFFFVYQVAEFFEGRENCGGKCVNVDFICVYRDIHVFNFMPNELTTIL